MKQTKKNSAIQMRY